MFNKTLQCLRPSQALVEGARRRILEINAIVRQQSARKHLRFKRILYHYHYVANAIPSADAKF